MKNLTLVIIIIFIVGVGGLGGYYLTAIAKGSNEKAESTVAEHAEQTSQKMSSDAEGAENSLTKIQTQRVVTVKVTLLPEKSSNDKVVFEIVMDTHSVDLLQYEIDNVAEVSIDKKASAVGTVWEPSSNDSHHVIGYLTWSGERNEDYKQISLTLKNIDNIPERVFSWQKDELDAAKFI